MTVFTIELLVGALGTCIEGLDLKRDLDASTVKAVWAAWLEYMVLIFPKQDLAPKEQTEVAAKIGRPCENPFVIPVVKEPEDRLSFGNGWHSDQTLQAVPPMGSLLFMKEIPKKKSGDTIWSNMYAAFEALSPAMQSLVDDLVAEHEMQGTPTDRGRSTPRWSRSCSQWKSRSPKRRKRQRVIPWFAAIRKPAAVRETRLHATSGRLLRFGE